MNTTIFWHLVWKEYRQQRDLMIAMVVITCAILAMMLAWAWIGNEPRPISAMYHLVFMMPIFYALGCGATLFAAEHERETFSFLHGLPIDSRDVFRAKTAVGFASCAVVAALLFLAGLAFSLSWPTEPETAAVCLITTVVILALAVFYSLLMRNPLWAVAAAGLTFFAVLVATVSVLSSFDRMHSESSRPWAIGGVQLVLFFVVLVANVRLGRRWLERDGTRSASIAAEESESNVPALPQPAGSATRLLRLLWQSCRETWILVAAVYVAMLLLSVLLIVGEAPPGILWAAYRRFSGRSPSFTISGSSTTATSRSTEFVRGPYGGPAFSGAPSLACRGS
jgi:ABC-type transport system involved in multi-copper enzyme maturation permease subunit